MKALGLAAAVLGLALFFACAIAALLNRRFETVSRAEAPSDAETLFVGLVHLVAEVTVGPVGLPFGPAGFAWTVVVNGAVLGLIVAGHAHLHPGALSDLTKLRRILPCDDAGFAKLRERVPNLSTPVRFGATILGVAGGLAVATLDPTLRHLYDEISPGDTR